MRLLAIFPLLGALAALAPSAAAGEPAAEVPDVIRKYLAAQPEAETAEVFVEVYRRVGVSELRTDRPLFSILMTRSLRGRGEAARMRLDVLKPSNMVGISMLAAWDAQRRAPAVLRFVPGRQDVAPVYLATEFLETHLHYEHAIPLYPGRFKFAVKEPQQVDGAACTVVEAVPATDSRYSRGLLYFGADGRLRKAEYYKKEARGEELVLTRQAKSADVDEWVMNKTGEKTVVTVRNRSSSAPPEDRFTPQSLISDPGTFGLVQERSKMLDEREALRREAQLLREEIAKLKAGPGR